MAENKEKDTKKTTEKSTTKKETTKKEVAKKDEKEVKKPKTTKTAAAAKKVTQEPKNEQKKEVKKDNKNANTVKAETKENKASKEVKQTKTVDAPKGKVTVETKKFDIKNNKKASSKNDNSKKIAGVIIVIAVIAIVALLTVLIVTSSDPKKSVDGYLTNLKAGEFEKAKEFTTAGDILNDKNYTAEANKLLFDKMTWKVKKVTTQENTATVEIEITNKDFSEVVQNCMKRMLSNFKAVLGGTLTTQDIGKYFEEELRNENINTKTTTGNIKLEKQDKKWKVIIDEEIENILLPNLENSINYLQ